MDIDDQSPEIQAALQHLSNEARRRGCQCLRPMFLSREELVAPEHWDRLPPENQHLLRTMMERYPRLEAFLDHEIRCPIFQRDWAPYN